MSPRRVVLVGNFLSATGIQMFIPMLPIYLGVRGATPAIVGLVFTAGVVGRGIVLYPAGWLADRYSPRVVMVGTMALYALMFLVYLLPLPAPAFIVVRFLHTLGGGGFDPAARAELADLTPADQRGKVYGQLQSSFMAGFLLGPTVGGFLASFDLHFVFVAAACLSVVATIALVTLPRVRHTSHAAAEIPAPTRDLLSRLVPLLIIGSASPWLIGAYNAVWPIYIHYRGAGYFLIGLSYAVFAIPGVLLSGRAGALADRVGHWKVVVFSTLGSGFFAAIYPFIASVPWLIGLGFVEGIFTLGGSPALTTLVSRSAGSRDQGRAQGLFTASQTVIQAISSSASGVLYGLSPTAAFLGITAACVIAVGSSVLTGGHRTAAGAPARA